jgi:hypothetical protein
MSSISSQEQTGEAYILVPPTVRINLTPLSGAVGSAPGPSGPVPSPSAQASDSADEATVNKSEMAKGLARIGAGAALSQMKPLEKKVETSSSSSSYVRPDGTRVTEKSSSSVGVSVNPAAVLNVIDVLFK